MHRGGLNDAWQNDEPAVLGDYVTPTARDVYDSPLITVPWMRGILNESDGTREAEVVSAGLCGGFKAQKYQGTSLLLDLRPCGVLRRSIYFRAI